MSSGTSSRTAVSRDLPDSFIFARKDVCERWSSPRSPHRATHREQHQLPVVLLATLHARSAPRPAKGAPSLWPQTPVRRLCTSPTCLAAMLARAAMSAVCAWVGGKTKSRPMTAPRSSSSCRLYISSCSNARSSLGFYQKTQTSKTHHANRCMSEILLCNELADRASEFVDKPVRVLAT